MTRVYGNLIQTTIRNRKRKKIYTLKIIVKKANKNIFLWRINKCYKSIKLIDASSTMCICVVTSSTFLLLSILRYYVCVCVCVCTTTNLSLSLSHTQIHIIPLYIYYLYLYLCIYSNDLCACFVYHL